MSKIIIVTPGVGDCPSAIEYVSDGVTKYDCSDFERGYPECNMENCPLSDSDSWKKELLEWIDKGTGGDKNEWIPPLQLIQKIREM